MFDGNPLGYGGWSEKSLNNPHRDRRGLGLLEYDLFSPNSEIQMFLSLWIPSSITQIHRNQFRCAATHLLCKFDFSKHD